MLGHKCFKILQVGLQIAQSLLKPRLALLIRRLKRSGAEDAGQAQSVAVDGSLESKPQVVVGNNDARCLQAGYVEGLACAVQLMECWAKSRLTFAKGVKTKPL